MRGAAPHHRLDVHGRQGELTLDFKATLAAPWTILFGPSGSGKSTVLRAICGLAPGLIAKFYRHERGTERWLSMRHTPPQRRRLAYAPQHAVLLPHLDVEQNVRFPESLRGMNPATSKLPQLVDLLQLAPLLRRRPHELSGGERQRTSLARALAVPDACLLLLDEPFAGLDRSLRDELVPALRAHLKARGLPVFSVTHDPDEALLLAAEVIRIREGHVVAQGPAPTVLADEVSRLRNLLATVPAPAHPKEVV